MCAVYLWISHPSVCGNVFQSHYVITAIITASLRRKNKQFWLIRKWFYNGCQSKARIKKKILIDSYSRTVYRSVGSAYVSSTACIEVLLIFDIAVFKPIFFPAEVVSLKTKIGNARLSWRNLKWISIPILILIWTASKECGLWKIFVRTEKCSSSTLQ